MASGTWHHCNSYERKILKIVKTRFHCGEWVDDDQAHVWEDWEVDWEVDREVDWEVDRTRYYNFFGAELNQEGF